jgi:hypothetical protein
LRTAWARGDLFIRSATPGNTVFPRGDELPLFYALGISTYNNPVDGGLEFSLQDPDNPPATSAMVEPVDVKGPNRRATAILPQNAGNERLKAQYFEFLREAKRKSDLTVRKVEIALLKFEAFLNFRTIESFDKAMALSFKDHMRHPIFTTPRSCRRSNPCRISCAG